MVPTVSTIGIMIGMYSIVRMVSFITRKGERKETSLVIVLSLINIFTTLFIIGNLFVGTLK